MKREDLQKAGHYEIHGETIAKFEFFQNGFNPYSRYLDVDKIDLILRKKENGEVRFIEVQVKYITLYPSPKKWDTKSNHCWRFFNLDEFSQASSSLYVALVLSLPNNYQGDIFIFPSKLLHDLINKSLRSKTKQGDKAKFIMVHDLSSDKWFLCTRAISNNYRANEGIDVSQYRRKFDFC